MGMDVSAQKSVRDLYNRLYDQIVELTGKGCDNIQSNRNVAAAERGFVSFTELYQDFFGAADLFADVAYTRKRKADFIAEHKKKVKYLNRFRRSMRDFVFRREAHQTSVSQSQSVQYHVTTSHPENPVVSASQILSRSSARSNASRLLLQEEQRRAEPLTRSASMQEQRNLEMSRLQLRIKGRNLEHKLKAEKRRLADGLEKTMIELKTKEEAMKLDTELRVSTTRLRVLENYEAGSTGSYSRLVSDAIQPVPVSESTSPQRISNQVGASTPLNSNSSQVPGHCAGQSVQHKQPHLTSADVGTVHNYIIVQTMWSLIPR